MKKIFTIIAGISCFHSVVIAQNKTDVSRNLNDVRQKFYTATALLEKEGKIEKEKKEGDGLMQQFHRWEWLMQSRSFPTGKLPDPSSLWNEWKNYQSTQFNQFDQTAKKPIWNQVGTNAVPSSGGGAGRINVIRFNPLNVKTIYIGAAGGGVWKTVDGGNSWSCLSDKYPVTSVADIAIDVKDTSNIYVATGDGYGYELGTDFWGGVYSAGILRSTDGGTTWAELKPKLLQSNTEIIQRLLINPDKSNILLKAARTGLYRSTNKGKTWALVLANQCHDMEWNTGNPGTVYAGGNGTLYRSLDTGATWNIFKSGLGGTRMSIEVTAINPLVIYILTSNSFNKTSDGGNVWTPKTFPSGATFYGYYDLMLACSPSNEDVLIAGGLNTVKTTNGGGVWAKIDNWSNSTAVNYVHADKHFGIFFPGSSTKILAGTDGGIFKTTDGGTNWADLSNGLAISQIYRLGTTPQNVNLVTSGWQDNGCNKWDGTNWKQIYGADGMETAIDYTNQNTIYECYQNGGLQKSLNGGTSWAYISPSSGDWVAPFVIDPVLNTRLYYGANSLYKSDNRGSSWGAVGGFSFGANAIAIAVAPSNNDIVYAASLGKIFKVTVSTNTSSNITAGLPVASAGINYIAVSNTNANHIWVALAGYSSGNKVYKSKNGGISWTNVSGTLPNMPVNTIVYQNNSDERVFIGTDIGVFETDSTITDWQTYNNGLPNVMVHELEINYTSNKLVAATYGRGIWQVALPAPSPLNVDKVETPSLKVSLFPNPTNGVVNIQVNNAVSDVIVEVYKLTGEKVAMYNYSPAASKSAHIDLSKQPFGNYIIRFKSGNAISSQTIQLNK